MKTILRIILAIFCYPSLLIHEFSHIIVSLIFLKKPDGMECRFQYYKPLEAAVFYDDNENRSFLASVMTFSAPFFSFVLFFILSMFFPFFRYIFVYQILTINYSFPSKPDLSNILTKFGITYKCKISNFRIKLNSWLYYGWHQNYLIQNEMNELLIKLDNDKLDAESRNMLQQKYNELENERWSILLLSLDGRE